MLKQNYFKEFLTRAVFISRPSYLKKTGVVPS